MIVNRLIVHKLEKNVDEKETTLKLSSKCLAIDSIAIDLVTKLDSSYKNKTKTVAKFDEEDEGGFPDLYFEYRDNISDNTFLEFSQKALRELKKIISAQVKAKGGYLVFCEYKPARTTYTAIYLIRNTEGVIFERKEADDSYHLFSLLHLDLDRLAFACKINIDKLQIDKDSHYLTLISKTKYEPSDYFNEWLAATSKLSSASFTKELLDMTSKLKLPEAEDGRIFTRDEFRKVVYDYTTSVPDRNISIRDLSEKLYGNEGYIQDFAIENDIEIDTEFKPDKRIMKKFISVEIKTDGIRMLFDRDKLHGKIRIDENNPSNVIITSEKFANELRALIEDE